MKYLLFAVLIFGWVHPLSKLILDGGIPLSFFCFAYVSIRWLAQIPVFFSQKKTPLPPKTKGGLLVLGLVGALLQFFEFKGIEQGLPPATVTFFMFSYPLWMLFIQGIFQKQPVGPWEVLQATFALLGMAFMAGGKIIFSTTLLYPLVASVLIATWISLSHHLRKKGVTATVLSFYYDLFSLIALGIYFSNSLPTEAHTFTQWAHYPKNILGLIAYSIGVGYLPNFLFYRGSQEISPLLLGTLMAFEPFLSAFYASLMGQQFLSFSFLLGGLCIFAANLPKDLFRKKQKISLTSLNSNTDLQK